jgi:hypothetical protein
MAVGLLTISANAIGWCNLSPRRTCGLISPVQQGNKGGSVTDFQDWWGTEVAWKSSEGVPSPWVSWQHLGSTIAVPGRTRYTSIEEILGGQELRQLAYSGSHSDKVQVNCPSLWVSRFLSVEAYLMRSGTAIYLQGIRVKTHVQLF